MRRPASARSRRGFTGSSSSSQDRSSAPSSFVRTEVASVPWGTSSLASMNEERSDRQRPGEETPLPSPAADHSEQSHAEALDDPVPAYGYETLPVVGLGGSAGGIPALGEILRRHAAEPGHGVRRRHAPGARPREHARRPAAASDGHAGAAGPGHGQGRDGPRLRDPAGQDAADGRRLTCACADLTPDRGRRVAVDLFFRTLADTHGPRAAAIVLSGADGDGAIGIKRIKERGGLTIAQDPDEAEHSSMPRSAIATGMVDWVLPVARDAGAARRLRRAGAPAQAAARRRAAAGDAATGRRRRGRRRRCARSCATCARAPAATSATTSGRRSCAASRGA